MIKNLLISLICTTTLFACRKEKISPVDPPKEQPPKGVARVKDSCSFTLDVTTLSYNTMHANSEGTGTAILDTSTRTYNLDTLQYHLSYEMIQYPSQTNGGSIEVSFVKNFAKTQLVRDVGFDILGPASDTVLFENRFHPYAVDYMRFWRQNGIAIVVRPGVWYNGALLSYIGQTAYGATAIPDNCQQNSKFEILKYIPGEENFGHIIEAKFSVNLFDQNEVLHRLENGYIRMHVN